MQDEDVADAEGPTEETGPSEITRAISLCETEADSAAVHMLLEEACDGRWSNVYTSVTYGPSADLSSIPTSVEEARTERLALLRVRLPINDAKQFISRSVEGSTTFDIFDVDFSCSETIEGFRPYQRWNHSAAGAMHSASSWRRERIGMRKALGTVPLSEESVYQIVDQLSVLKQARWLGIPLLEYPEKLGDIDEVWPSPALLHAKRATVGSGIDVYLEVDRLRLDPSRLTLSGTAYRDGLICSSVAETGAFPKRLMDADGVDLRLFVHGVLVDQLSGYFVKNVVAQLSIGSSTILQIPAHKTRSEMEVALGASDVEKIVVGGVVRKSNRAVACEIGRKFRDDRVLEDAERVYDVTSNPAAVKHAFADLGNFGKAQRGGMMTILDPYALDAQALFSIIAAALPHMAPSSVAVYTAFRVAPAAESSNTDLTWFRKQVEQCLRKAFRRRKLLVRPLLTQRDKARADFYGVAQQVFEATNVPIMVYDAPHLHDRFMLLRDRIWHVGPSFNTLGEEVAAIVEMRDPRRKAQIRAYLQRQPSEPVWQTR